MQEYARQSNLKRWLISVPVLTPRLSSLWLGLVTPVYARIGRKLVDSLRNPTLVRNHSARDVFTVKPKSVREAIERALRNEDQAFAQTRWSDALSSSGATRQWGGVLFGTRLVDSRAIEVSVPPAQAFIADSPDRRCHRLVFRWLTLVVARISLTFFSGAPDCAVDAATPTCSLPATRLTSGAWNRFEARSLAKAGSPDETPWTRLAPIRSRTHGQGIRHPPDGNLRSRRSCRPCLLVLAVSNSQMDFRRHAKKNCSGRRTRRTNSKGYSTSADWVKPIVMARQPRLSASSAKVRN